MVSTGGATTAEPNGRFSALMCLFLAAMSLAALADNLGVLWVAIEATTITTAFLVAHGGGRPGLEAAWKYVDPRLNRGRHRPPGDCAGVRRNR